MIGSYGRCQIASMLSMKQEASSLKEGTKLSFRRLGESMEQGTVIQSSGILKGLPEISDHEYKIFLANCFSPSDSSFKGAGAQ